jgi:hypothetical protein
MAATVLVHGVTWDGPPPGDAAPDAGSPALRLQSPPGGLSSVPIVHGASLSFRVLDGLWCLGHTKIHGPGERTHFPCPDAAPAARARELLDGIAMGGFSTLEEEWQRPAFADALCGPGRRHAYPAAFDAGEHGLVVESLSGGFALASLTGDSGEFVADLGSLKGRRIEFGDYRTEIPALQDSLF